MIITGTLIFSQRGELNTAAVLMDSEKVRHKKEIHENTKKQISRKYISFKSLPHQKKLNRSSTVFLSYKPQQERGKLLVTCKPNQAYH